MKHDRKKRRAIIEIGAAFAHALHTAGKIMIIPRPGDEWEFKCPGKPRKTKTLDSIRFWEFMRSGRCVNLITIWFCRRPKGRYTYIRPRVLLKYGRRLSTKAVRDADWQAFLKEAKNR